MKRTLLISRYTSEANLKALIVFCISAILAFLFVPNKWLDLYRYYGEAAKIDIHQSLFAYLKTTYLVNFDFVYYLLLYSCKSLNLPVQLVTAISVGLFYSQALILINAFQHRFDYKLDIYKRLFVDIAALLSVSFILVFSLSRNITALVFLFFGLINLIKGKKRAYIYFLIACFTHLVLIPYLILFFIVYYLNKYFPKEKLTRQILLIILTIICIYSMPIMNYFFSQISDLPFFDHYKRYMNYLMFRRRETFRFLGKWDILLFYSSALVMFTGLFLIKKYNGLVWISYAFYLFLVVSISFSVTLTQRTLIILVPFQGLVSSVILSQKNKTSEASIYIFLILLSLMLFAINVYSYRDYLIFSFPPL